jgi:alcohol dehydrogenase (cytochrome c)
MKGAGHWLVRLIWNPITAYTLAVALCYPACLGLARSGLVSRTRAFARLLISGRSTTHADAGRQQFESRCAGCHGGDGKGGAQGPSITQRIARVNDEQLALTIENGFPEGGMPGFSLRDAEMKELIAFLRTLRTAPAEEPVTIRAAVEGEGMIEGSVLGQSSEELELRTGRQISLLRKTLHGYRRVTSQADWPAYDGDLAGNRYSPLHQIDTSNVRHLAPAWIFPVPQGGRLEVTPAVAAGIMYVTGGYACYALDAGSGRELWRYSRPHTRELSGNTSVAINRGVALSGNRVFMVTDDAHMIALDKVTGALLWDTEMADWHLNYSATSAPLAAGDLVISGTAGGDQGIRGFIAAFQQSTGKEVWRFWTVPGLGEPGSETWAGKDLAHPGAAAWFTGSYDEQLGTVYWQTGNPGDDYDGDFRPGDNLYSCSIVALDAHTGKLKWHYQFTPHDLRDWDATQPAALVDTVWHGRPAKLLLQANRNGFFYVLDRTNGELLLAKPFVENLTWAKEIGKDGRPVLIPGQDPTEHGRTTCPALEGATNWFSTSFHPGTGLYYVQTLERCSIYVKRPTEWQLGQSFIGGSVLFVPGEKPKKVLRALDIQTGRVAWEFPQSGPGNSWGGVLSTAGGTVFYGDDSGCFAAVDAKSGKRLWCFPVNDLWKASPMTYMFDGKQYVSVAVGATVAAFSLH